MTHFLVSLIIFFSNSIRAQQCSTLPTLRKFMPKYAKNFQIEYKENFKIVSTLSEHYLVAKDLKKIKCDYKFKLKQVENNVVMTSTTYLPVLSLLQKQNTLVAFQGKKYIYDSHFDLSKITDIGFTLNPENLLGYKPQLILAYPENLQNINDLAFYYRMSLPLVLSYEHLENTALGRAEWVVFNAAFFGEEEKGIKFFNEIEQNYILLSKSKKVKRKVLIGDVQNGFWVFPGASSDFSKIVQDAGAELILNVSSNKTQRISLEEFINKKIKPDLWLLNNNVQKLKELDHPIYKDLKNIPIYNYVNRVNRNGANDFWETSISRPDLVLKDMLNILTGRDNELTWYKRI